MRRSALVMALASVTALGGGAGCTVGNGNGAAKGPLFVIGCDPDNSDLKNGDFRSDTFDLNPSFFAGEPIEDISQTPVQVNRLLIRMQRNGNRVEINDTLFFDVQSAYEVARCVRGWIDNGVPQWDQRKVSNLDGTMTDIPWCNWSGTAGTAADGGGDGDAAGTGAADGGTVPPVAGTRARIHFGPEEYLRAALLPLYTCNKARLTATAVEGWIDFLEFGQAARPTVDPSARGKIGGGFKVNFGEYLRANFHVVLQDQRVLTAIKDRDPLPHELIGSTLDGFFDFQLDRGRAAQPFP